MHAVAVANSDRGILRRDVEGAQLYRRGQGTPDRSGAFSSLRDRERDGAILSLFGSLPTLHHDVIPAIGISDAFLSTWEKCRRLSPFAQEKDGRHDAESNLLRHLRPHHWGLQ